MRFLSLHRLRSFFLLLVSLGMLFAVGCATESHPVDSKTKTGGLTISQPADVTVVAGDTVKFSVSAANIGTTSYQWFRDGKALNGAISPILTMAVAHLSDSKSTFSVKVWNDNGAAVTSDPAILTVIPIQPVLRFDPVTQQVFGAAPFTVDARSTSPATITYVLASGLATLTGNAVSTTAAGPLTIAASQPAIGDYAAAQAQLTVNVIPATPHLVFQAVPDLTFEDPAVPVHASSESNGNITYAVVNGPGSLGAGGLQNSGAGSITVQASQAATDKYTSATATLTVQVAKKKPVLTFSTVATLNYGAAPVQLHAASTSDGSITYVVSSGPGSIAGDLLTVTSAGAIQLRALQAETANFLSATATATLNVSPGISISQVTPADETSGPGSRTYAATVSGGVSNKVIWSASAGSFTGDVWTSPNQVGTYTILATSAEDPTKHASTTAIVSPPIITRQPTSVRACPGSLVALNISALYADSYLWHKGNTNLVWAISQNLSLGHSAAAEDAGTYYATAMNAAGKADSASVNVLVGSSITTNPHDANVAETQTATFAVVASGMDPFTYQWFVLPQGSASARGIQGATSASFTTAPVQQSDSGSRYYVQITDQCGTVLTSDSAKLAVSTSKVPPTIVEQPQDQTLTVGATGNLEVVATGTPTLKYQWFRVPAGQVVGVAVPNATDAKLLLDGSATQFANDRDAYFVVVTNDYGQATSRKAVLTIGTGIQIVKQPANVYTQPGETANLSVVAKSELPLTYQWLSAAPGSNVFTALPGETNPTLTVSKVTAIQNGTAFKVKVSNGTNRDVMSDTAVLFVSTQNGIDECSTGWTLGGDATQIDGCSVRLHPGAISQHGSIVWPHLLATDSLRLAFTVQISNTSPIPADGFAVVLGDPTLGATPASVGANGEGLGARGIPGLVVAFDDYRDTWAFDGIGPDDPSVPYLGVGRGEDALWENPYSNVNTGIPLLAAQGQAISHAYVVTITHGMMTVTMDGQQVFSGFVDAPPVAYMYVTSSTGGYYEETQISHISLAVQ